MTDEGNASTRNKIFSAMTFFAFFVVALSIPLDAFIERCEFMQRYHESIPWIKAAYATYWVGVLVSLGAFVLTCFSTSKKSFSIAKCLLVVLSVVALVCLWGTADESLRPGGYIGGALSLSFFPVLTVVFWSVPPSNTPRPKRRAIAFAAASLFVVGLSLDTRIRFSFYYHPSEVCREAIILYRSRQVNFRRCKDAFAGVSFDQKIFLDEVADRSWSSVVSSYNCKGQRLWELGVVYPLVKSDRYYLCFDTEKLALYFSDELGRDGVLRYQDEIKEKFEARGKSDYNFFNAPEEGASHYDSKGKVVYAFIGFVR